ncbi:MAG TPA: Spy/CpxP family protein refolding chaperone [Polyangia bacterium]
MHPGLVSWWHAQRAGHGHGHGCGPAGGWAQPPWGWAGHRECSPGGGRGGDDCGDGGGSGGDGFDDGGGGGGFGVRRPLRFLAYKLELEEGQVSELARILAELKTDRAQAEVDRRRTTAAFADAVASDTFDTAKAAEGGALRVTSAERLRDAVIKALQQIHAVLDEDQRKRLAYLIRTGTLII